MKAKVNENELCKCSTNKQNAACGLHCIKMKDIGVKIGKNQIIEHINLHIHCGKITCIIGKNGAGKSTLMKAIVGELPYEGEIQFRDMKDETLSDMVIGYVPQHLNISKNTPTSVYDLFAGYISRVPIFLWKSKKLYQKIYEQLSLFDAQHLIDQPVCDLSGGELQRVMLSIATMPIPNLMLLDEPISGVDHNGMELFYRNIDRLRREYDLAILLVSHDFAFVEKYADYVILLDRTIVKEGTAAEVLHSKEFERMFGSTGR